MKSHRISFATVFDLGDRVYSIVVDEGYELQLYHVEELHSFFASETGGESFVLLVQRLYNYSYSAQTKEQITKMPNLLAVALVVYDEDSMELGSEMMKISKSKVLKFNLFTDEKRAEQWLRDLLEEHRLQEV